MVPNVFKSKTEIIKVVVIALYLSFNFIIQELLLELGESVVTTVIIQV